jgi:1-deoxy-D-xylulose-5-phosphate reductoisomerase
MSVPGKFDGHRDSGEQVGVAIIGSTGSIGTQTLEVIEHHPNRFRVVALCGASNLALLAEQAKRHRPDLIVTHHDTEDDVAFPAGARRESGPAGMLAAATHPDVDIVVVASAGHSAIEPTIEAIKLRKTIALANKESIVCAGNLIIPLARETGAAIHPVDSEHSAIWQSLDRGSSAISRLILTASGGPFLHLSLDELENVSVDQALSHPTWKMGGKITIDSATMMNKGLEIIEAHWLFDIDYANIDVLIHPESIVHSIVEYEDCSQIAQLSLPDMRLPIQYALTYPRHLAGPCKQLKLQDIQSLTFQPLDQERFPAIRLAREAGTAGGSYPTVLSTADEVTVDAFLKGAISFTEIVQIVESTLSAHQPISIDSVETLRAVDAWSREYAASLTTHRRDPTRS